jgi:hypothetical protein
MLPLEFGWGQHMESCWGITKGKGWRFMSSDWEKSEISATG